MDGKLTNCVESMEVWSRNRRRNMKDELDHHRVTMVMFRGGNEEQTTEKLLEAQSEYNKSLIKED